MVVTVDTKVGSSTVDSKAKDGAFTPGSVDPDLPESRASQLLELAHFQVHSHD